MSNVRAQAGSPGALARQRQEWRFAVTFDRELDALQRRVGLAADSLGRESEIADVAAVVGEPIASVQDAVRGLIGRYYLLRLPSGAVFCRWQHDKVIQRARLIALTAGPRGSRQRSAANTRNERR